MSRQKKDNWQKKKPVNDDPRAFLERLIDENPGATDDELQSLFLEEVKDNDAMRRTVIKWCFRNYRLH
jgi:hypothetical protein